jgi:hypothetical protein
VKSFAAVALVALVACSSSSDSLSPETTDGEAPTIETATTGPGEVRESTWTIDTPVDPSIWTSVEVGPPWALASLGRPVSGPVSPPLPDTGGQLADGVYRLEILYSPDQSDRPPTMAMVRRFAGCDEFTPPLTGDFCARGEGTVYYPGEDEPAPPDVELILDGSTRVVVRTRACLGDVYDDVWIVDWPTFFVSMMEFADSTREWSNSLLGRHGIEPGTPIENVDYSLEASGDLRPSDCLTKVAWSPPASIDGPGDGDRQPVPWFFPVQTWLLDSPLMRVWQSSVLATAIEVSAGRYTLYFDAVAMPFREFPE